MLPSQPTPRSAKKLRFYSLIRFSLFFCVCFGHFSASIRSSDPDEILFSDGFEKISPGALMPVVGPHPEYHFLREAVAVGDWAVTTFDSASDSQTAWRAIRSESGKASLQQTYTGKAKHWHPMVVAGDRMWKDYRVKAMFAVEGTTGRIGVAVRQQNDRCYYFVGVDNDRLILMRVQHEVAFQVPGEEILDSTPIERKPNQNFYIEVSLVGDTIHATVHGTILSAKDSIFQNGSIALLANVPARFDNVQVACTPNELTRFQSAKLERETQEREFGSKQPAPVLWRKIPTPQFGTDRNIRFGDLNGDGQVDLLVGQITHHGPTDSNSEIACMTAIDLDGNILWRNGTPDRWKNHLTNDVAFQIHDLNGDGKNEVVYCQGQEIIIAEGATGKKIRSRPTPLNLSNRVPFNRFPRILGDSLLFADLRGSMHRKDILLKDRYQNVWAMDDELADLWQVQCNTGHFVFPIDTDHDGREEILVGYSKIAPNGQVLWSHDDRFKDHVDSVAVVDLDGNGTLETIWGASDEGFVLLDANGIPRVHLRLGHVQNLTVADFRPDLRGLEIVAANFWKNQGIIHILDSSGNVLLDIEPRPEHGSAIVPVFWNGDGSELFMVGPDPIHGGLWDGFGRRVVRLPADGHPTKSYDALNLTGDPRDELIVWDSQEIWIYTQSTTTPNAVKAAPNRNSLSNESNYRARVSIPADFVTTNPK